MNIPYGRTVWFVWMNSTDAESTTIFDHIAGSIKFGKNTPTTLQEAYGQDFQPIPLHQESSQPQTGAHLARVGRAPGLNAYREARFLAPSGYSVPVGGPTTRYIKCGNINAPVCGGTHSGSAAKAIDISMPVGVGVLNSADSRIYGIYYGTSGYGWYVTMRDTNLSQGYIAYYAHLSSIDQSGMQQIQDIIGYVPRGFPVGQSGQTGGVAPHLHFHVRTTGWAAVNLAGMPNLTLYSSYPNCGYTTCPGGTWECTCGRVY